MAILLTIPCSGQVQTLLRTASYKIIYPVEDREAKTPHPVQQHVPVDPPPSGIGNVV